MAFSKGLGFLDVHCKKKVIQNGIMGSLKIKKELFHKHKDVMNPYYLDNALR